MLSPSPSTDTRPQSNRSDNIKHALQALMLITGVVVVDLSLFVIVVFLTKNGYLPSNSIFPAMIVFLLFALSVGIILIIALGERITGGSNKNAWGRKFGVTPVMVVVSTIIGIFVSTSLLANRILPVSDIAPFVLPQFMLANLGIRCQSKAAIDPPQATGLLTLITSSDAKYVNDVKDFLHKLKKESTPKFQFNFVQKDNTNEFYKLLLSYSRSTGVSSGLVRDELRSEDNWIAYTVDVRQPQFTTFVPVPTMYDKQHNSHFFLITTGSKAKGEQTSIAAISPAVPVKGAEPAKKDLVPLFLVAISPKLVSGEPEVDQIDFQIFHDPDRICWEKPLG